MSGKPRTPGIVYAAISLAMLAVLGVVAVSTRQPPPPSIAEFAPNAVEKIEDAPDEQTSGTEIGDGICPPEEPDCDLPSPTPTPKPKDGKGGEVVNTIDVPRVRKCVGDPPRQIEDPQSPPCVPYWDGDNGGATWQGVTRDTIRVSNGGGLENIADAARFFNRRFEFYGRKIEVVDTTESQNCDDAAGGRATAAAEDDEFKLFAANHTCGSGPSVFAYTAELARRGIVYVDHESPLSSTWMRQHHPHLWQYPMEADGMFAHLGEWACKRLAGRNARHAGTPDLQGDKRVFGVLLQAQNEVDTPIETTELTSRLEACGAKAPVVRENIGTGGVANAIIEMKTSGVTSIFCLCHYLDEPVIGGAATAQAYFPEWLLSSFDLNHGNFTMRSGLPTEQRENAFGIAQLPMQVATADWPGTWACNEIQCNTGEDLGTLGAYHSMLVIASGIQMAGPNLTPATFAAGLHKARFPNPDHPIIAGKVGFDRPIVRPDAKYSAEENMPHGMTQDSIEWWWSETAPSQDGNGAMCYVARKRYRLGEFPNGSDDVFFRGACDTGV